MAKRQHKIKIFLSIGKIPCFCQKNSKNPEKLIVFQGFYSGQHFYPLNMEQETGIEPAGTSLGSWRHTIRRLLRFKLNYYTVFADFLQSRCGKIYNFAASFFSKMKCTAPISARCCVSMLYAPMLARSEYLLVYTVTLESLFKSSMMRFCTSVV